MIDVEDGCPVCGMRPIETECSNCHRGVCNKCCDECIGCETPTIICNLCQHKLFKTKHARCKIHINKF